MVDDYQITDETRIKFHNLYRDEEEDGFIRMGKQNMASCLSIPAEAVEINRPSGFGNDSGRNREHADRKIW